MAWRPRHEHVRADRRARPGRRRPAPRRQSPWRRVAADFVTSKTAVFGLAVIVLLAAAALAAPWITPQNPYDLMQLDVLDARLAPGSPNGAGTFTYWLGTDGQGRDLYSGMLYGLRISLGVGSARPPWRR